MHISLRHFLRTLIASFLISVPALVLAAESSVTKGYAIGSSGFNDMLGKQTKEGTFTTEQQADGSFVLLNKMQTVSAHITTEGVAFDSIGNSTGKGGFSLQLTQWGRAEALQAAPSASLYRDGDVVYHQHKDGIAERFSNTSDGIRQDFIVPIKPAGQGILQVALQVGGAKVEPAANGAFIALDSGRRLTYNNLKVTDSTGKSIPAQMQVAGNNIHLQVDDTAAQYPLTIDPTVGDANWMSMGGCLGACGDVNAVAVYGSMVYAAGDFIAAGNVLLANHIAKWDGTAWSALGSGIGGVDDGTELTSVYALAVDSNGNLYAGGVFTMAGGVAANRVAKWDGTAWSALGSDAQWSFLGFSTDASISSLVVDSSGTLYAGGMFDTAGGTAANHIARWDGSVWSALGSGMNNVVQALAVDSSGNLYAGGNFTKAGGVVTNYIAKWNGTAWSALGSGVNDSVRALAVDSSGTVYAGGLFTKAGGIAGRYYVAKWNGTVWGALGSGMNEQVNTLALDSSGTLYAGGWFDTAGGVAANRVAKWNGTAWSALGGGSRNIYVDALAVDSSGNVYAGGSGTANFTEKWDGTAWSTLGSGISYNVRALATDNNGNLYTGGQFTTAGGDSQINRVAKWNGTAWSALGSGMNKQVNALAVDSSGNLYAGGQFTTAGGVAANYIAKWNGAAWSALGSGMNNNVLALAMGSSGNLYAGGQFTTAGGVAANRVAKWNGVAWSALGNGMGSQVNALAVDSSGNLYAGGQFIITVGGVAANRVAKWNGTAWSALGSGMNNNVLALAVDSSGAVYAGGQFTTAGGVAANRVAKWNGTAWSALGSGMNNNVLALAVDSSGAVYAGGQFTTAGGVAVNQIVRWDSTAWSALGSGVSGLVWALAADSSGNVYAGGSFITAGGQVSPYLAKWLEVDIDGDDVDSIGDNCPAVFNPGQEDADGDGIGDVCDSTPNGDTDGDGVDNAIDNCLAVSNSDQKDTDGDGIGDACDSTPNGDTDGDGVDNAIDNCLAVFNPGQEDADGDSVGDACDAFPNDPMETADSDGDGVGDNADNCLMTSNPSQTDTDGDGMGDVCDSTPNGDTDGDGVDNNSDNCPLVVNVDQKDSDGDGIGDVCDDSDGDGINDSIDNCPVNANSNQLDWDGDSAGDACSTPVPMPGEEGLVKSERVGTMVAFVGDFNGDGYGDYAIGTPRYTVPAAPPAKAIKGAGFVRIISGRNGDVLFTSAGASAGDGLGTAIAGNADINNDGLMDVVVGAPLADNATVSPKIIKDTGLVRVIYGCTGMSCMAAHDIYGNDVDSTLAKSYFGAALALGDINNDNRADVIIGAPHADALSPAKLVDAGRVVALSGADLTALPLFDQYGVTAKAYAGTSVAAGDMDGTAGAEIVVGAPKDDDTTRGVKDTGSVRVYKYNAADTQNPAKLLERFGGIAKAAFGQTVTVGDIDGDGVDDVLVGAPTDDDNSLKDAGSITAYQWNGMLLTKQYGATAKANLGVSVVLGDVTGDGKADLIAGAWKDDKPSSPKAIKDTGSVTVWNADGFISIDPLYGSVKGDAFGTAVSVGDINGDGKADLIIGIPGFDIPPALPIKAINDAGKVQLVSGAEL